MLANIFVVAKSFRFDLRAVTSLEYALIAMLIFLVIIGSVTILGGNLIPLFNAAAAGI